MVIHLIRHLKAVPGGVEPGQLDPRIEVSMLFCSPLERARKTAEMFFPHNELIVIPELAEISMGEWEGRSWEQIQAAWPDLARQKLQDWFTVTPPGGESWSGFEARVSKAWLQVHQAVSPCAVVAHAAVNFVLAKLITGRELTQPQHHGEVITLEIP